jgi:multidrug efflux pump subunit AcrA (membrane-fusion protein)
MASAGSGQKGLRLPETAIVRYEGDTFVYVQTNGEDFERWRVKLGPPLRDGVFVTSGVTAQDNVVINAAAQLLSEELKAASGGSD